MIVRDLKVRYKRSFLGLIWVMLNPLLQMTVLFVVFSAVFRYAIPHYTVYLLSGILTWALFAQGTVASMDNLKANASILRKLYVPPSVFVVSAIGSALVNLVFSLAPFFALVLLNGLMPRWSWLFTVVPLVEIAVFALGVGLVLSATFVFFHDTFEIYQVFTSVYYFLTPIFYPVAALAKQLRLLEQYNPMYLFISEFRAAVMGTQLPDVQGLLIPVLISLAILAVGWTFFTRVEARFVFHL